jgi:hypothetical protein
MDNNVLNSLVLYKSKYFNDLIDENKISNALTTQRADLSTTLSYIFGVYEGAGNVIDLLTNGLGRTVTIDSNEYTWDVMIDHERAVTIRDARWNATTIAATDTPGIGQTPVQVWVDERLFGPGAIVAFDDRTYRARVEGAGYQDGNEWVYTLVVADGQPDSFISPTVLAKGCQLSREGSAYEENSEEADIVNYMTPFKMKNRLNISRLSYDITGSAYSTVMVIEMKVPGENKSTKYWADYQEWVAMRQWFKTLDRWGYYSRHNGSPDGTTLLKGTNGRPVFTGAGVEQQVSPANIRSFTTLTLDVLQSFMSDLSFNILDKSQRKFVALAGEMFLSEFDRVVREKALGMTTIDTVFISGSGQELTLGGQFTTYKWLNGMELTVKHFPLFDDVILNRKLHPVSGRPLESYKALFLDLGMRDGEPNLQKVVRRDREMVMWHTGGSVAPHSGHAKSIDTLRSNAKDGYAVHFLSEYGYMMKDPTTSGILFCDAE